MTGLLAPAALSLGVLLAVQASVNPQLARAVGTPFGGAAVQLWVAVGLLALAAVSIGAFAALGSVSGVPAWHLLGGLASPLYITSGILLIPRIGALAAGGLFVAGQVLGSVTLDALGLLGVDRRPVALGLVAGVGTVLVGLGVVVRAQAATVGPSGRSGVGWAALGLLAGGALPVQGAVNARLRTALLDPVAVALTSFVVAAVTITVVLAVLRLAAVTPAPRLDGLRVVPWWGWLGGACAVGYVTGTFLLIPIVGAATTVVLTITGQQVAGAVIDSRGAFGLPRRPVTARRALGLSLLVVGAALVELLSP